MVFGKRDESLKLFEAVVKVTPKNTKHKVLCTKTSAETIMIHEKALQTFSHC